MTPQVAIIVAKAKDNGIGCSEGLPWHITEELQYFKRRTSKKPVIMGRKTYESIVNQLGSSLPNRTNIIVSRSGFVPKDPNAIVCTNLDEAISAAKNVATQSSAEEIFIIGGEQIFQQAIPQADRIYLTRIDMNCTERDANAFLKDELFSDLEWKKVETNIQSFEEKLSMKMVQCDFQVLERI